VSRPPDATKLLALLGDPVAHSLSPTFQNAAIRAAGLDGVYVALRCTAGALPELLLGIARLGGGGNVTVPHKELAARTVDHRTRAVELTGACNTFWLEDGEVWGDNPDVAGAGQAIRALLGDAAPREVLLLGAGGSARAVLLALRGIGTARVHLVNRNPLRAEELKTLLESPDFEISVATPADDLSALEADLAVNATPLGLHLGDPLPPTAGARYRAALDLVYSPADTEWVRRCRVEGIPAADGKEMLLGQGAAAFRRWWGIDPPLDAMRKAVFGGTPNALSR
jgi:shikimate dehydrogenase